MELVDLPENWAWATVRDVAETIFGQSPPSSTYNTLGKGLPFFQGKAEFGLRSPVAVKWCTTPTREASAGDILISVRAPVGPTNIADRHCAIGRGLAAIRPFVDPAYVQFWLKRSEQSLAAKGTGTTFSAISKSVLNTHPLPLAPLNEQRRIVEKVETLFSRIDQGEAALRQIQTLLARYRQSVLKAAVTGQLTADWRTENAHRLEPGQDLLQRILQTRRETWQGRGKYKEPTAPDTTNLPELPEGWVWASVDQVARETMIGLVRSSGQQNVVGHGVRYIKMDRIDMYGNLSVETDVRVEASPDEIEKFTLKLDDILFNTRNSLELVGKVGRVDSNPCEPTIFNNNLMRIRLVPGISPAFVCTQMCSPIFRKRMELVKRATTSVAAVYGGDLKTLPLAIPPLEEQNEICSKVTEKINRLDKVVTWCQTELTRSTALRQSILKQAFAGRLVPQDPNDEPASELLARIRSRSNGRAPGLGSARNRA